MYYSFLDGFFDEKKIIQLRTLVSMDYGLNKGTSELDPPVPFIY